MLNNSKSDDQIFVSNAFIALAIKIPIAIIRFLYHLQLERANQSQAK